jgi:hypothetical protein
LNLLVSPEIAPGGLESAKTAETENALLIMAPVRTR